MTNPLIKHRISCDIVEEDPTRAWGYREQVMHGLLREARNHGWPGDTHPTMSWMPDPEQALRGVLTIAVEWEVSG